MNRRIQHTLRTLALSILITIIPTTLVAQDTTLNRNVTVERDFQPIVHSAGMVSVKPTIVQQELEPVEVSYSAYSQPLSPAFNINPLGCSLTTWNQPKPLHGYVSGGIGHTNTAFDFGYRMDDKKSKITLDTYAHHRASWGRYTIEKTTFGLDVTKTFAQSALYFGADATNQYYTFSGRYVDSTGAMPQLQRMSQLKDEDKLSLWTINTRIGIRSASKTAFQYLLQSGYSSFIHTTNVTEHQIRTRAQLVWDSAPHKAGLNVQMANLFMSVHSTTILPTEYNARHAIRIEPFYAYDANRLHAHIGVNLDMNIGRGQLLSSNENITFAPSPNVRLEYDITRNWLAVYGEATGFLGEGSMQAYTNLYPYRRYEYGVTSHHVAGYIPVQAQLGLKIRPQANLLIDLHARYEWKKNQLSTCNPYYWEEHEYYAGIGSPSEPIYGDYVYSHLQRWKIGAEITYHYQDIVHILLSGGFYTGSMDSIEAPRASKGKAADLASFDATVRNADGTFKMLDRPRWDLRVNIDARINRQWTLYSHNYFTGSRMALMYQTTASSPIERTYSIRKLIPTIDLNIGCAYEFNKWLSVYAELNNYIHRHNVTYYGYVSPGANFLIGASYKF